jgi:hypothetical protein
MKNPTSIQFLYSGLALTLALAIWIPVQARAADPTPASGKMMMDGRGPEHRQEMIEHRQAMLERHKAMIAELKAQDAELATQLTKMNSAPKDQKLDQLAAIVTRLVEQRAAMTARMEKMQGEMMMPMAQEPMMEGMKDKPDDMPKMTK